MKCRQRPRQWNNGKSRRANKLSADEAGALYDSCLLVREGKSSTETLECASVLLEYAWLSHMMGKAEEAEGKARRSLGIKERILGSQHPDVAKVLTGEALSRISVTIRDVAGKGT